MSIKTIDASTDSLAIREDSNSRLPMKLSTVSSTYIFRILFSRIALSVSRICTTCLIVFSMVNDKSSKFIGLVMKSKAPRFMAVRMFSISPYAETITDLINGLDSLNRLNKVKPSISGILISLRTISTSGCKRIFSNASIPFTANTNSYSCSRIFCLNFCLISISRSTSSSATKIFAMSLLFKFFF